MTHKTVVATSLGEKPRTKTFYASQTSRISSPINSNLSRNNPNIQQEKKQKIKGKQEIKLNMSKAGQVKLLEFWSSPFCMRVRIALEEKGVHYEDQQEDLFGGKSELLLKSNPIHQKVPVLLHDDKPVIESSNIVTYIDETWPSNPLLPSCAYDRAHARFWADFIDKKVLETGSNIWQSKGGEQEVAKKDFIEILKHLEGALGEKNFFGGDAFGYLDIIAIPLTTWFLAYEKIGGFKVGDHCPKFSAWIKRCLQRQTVAKVLADPEKVYQFVLTMQKMHGLA